MFDREAPPDSIIMMAEKLILLENSKQKVNHRQLGLLHYYKASAHSELQEWIEARASAVIALKKLSQSDYQYTNSAIELISDIYLQIQENNLLISRPEEETKEESVFYQIKSILSRKGDTILVEINGGLNDGIYMGSSGGVLSAYSKELPERGNDEIGNCKTIKVEATRTVVEIVLFERAVERKLEPLPGDNLMLKTRVPKRIYRKNLFQLSLVNVHFKNSSKKEVFPKAWVLNELDSFSEKAIIQYLLEDQRGTAEWLYDTATMKNSTEYPVLSAGSKKGLNMWEAMLQSNTEDVLAFLRFVESYPAKYMSRGFRMDETFATWLINYTPPGDLEWSYVYEKIAEEKPDSQLIQKLYNNLNYYINYHTPDSKNLTEHWNEVIEHWIEENNKIQDSILSFDMLEKQILFVSQIGNDTIVRTLKIERARLFHKYKLLEKAEQSYKDLLKYNIENYNIYWYRAHLFYEQERYKEALADFEEVSNAAPWSPDPFGMRGWILQKTGKFAQAFELCKKAYDMDSFNYSWTVNMGHAYFLRGDYQVASAIYDRAMSLAISNQEFYGGLIADFDLFLSNGWNTSQVNSEKSRTITFWKEKYENRFLADSAFRAGKVLHEEKKYMEAIASFQFALACENRNTTPDQEWIRAYTRWIAFSYYNKKDYQTSLDHYLRAWNLTKTHLHSLEFEIQDLRDIGNLYDWIGQVTQRDVIRQVAAGLQRKLDEQYTKSRLIIFSAGAPEGLSNTFKGCESDAKMLSSMAKMNGELLYDTVFNFQIIGQNFTLKNFREKMGEVLSVARTGDVLLFYFAGNTVALDKKHGFLIGKDTLFLDDLYYWSNSILSQKQFFIWDIPNQGHLEAFLGLKNKQILPKSSQLSDLVILTNKGTRIEPEQKGSLLSGAIIEALQGKANVGFSSTDRSVSAKEVETYVYEKLGRNYHYIQVASYTEGLDFPLVSASISRGMADLLGPKLQYTLHFTGNQKDRGAEIEESTSNGTLNGQVVDESGVSELYINGIRVNLATNGKFSYNIVEEENSILMIEAKDKVGNITLDTVKLVYQNRLVEEAERKVVNRALLFGTDLYDEWSDLSNPISDVNVIGKVLKDYYGYQVTIVHNATQQEVREKLDSFLRLSYGPQDQLIVFFAGHGMLDSIYGGQLVCKDSRRNDRTLQSYFSFHQLANSLSGARNCRHILLVLDVCFGGRIFSQQVANAYMGQDIYSAQKDRIRFEKIMSSRSRMYITSGGETYVPDGRPGYHSPFASRFIQALEAPLKDGNKSYLTLKDVVDYMRDLPENQEPRYGSFDNESEFDKNADIALKPVQRYGALTKNVSFQNPSNR